MKNKTGEKIAMFTKNDGINQLRFRTKQELAYEEIKRAIILGHLEPNERIIISKIAEKLNVSESPVREALKRLASENFIVEQGNTIYVAALPVEQFINMLLKVRLDLEIIAIRLAVYNITEADITKLHNVLALMDTYLETESYTEYDALHRKFHNTCCSFCNISYLYRAIADASDVHERGLNIFKLAFWRDHPEKRQHEALLEAFKNKDEDAAVSAWVLNRKQVFEFTADQVKRIYSI